MGFWGWQLQVWRRAVTDARRTAIPHSFIATARLGAVLILTTVAMLAANQWLHIVDRGLMSEDNIKDNLITLGVFVPFSLVAMFVGLILIEGLFLVPYKLWKEASAAIRQIEHADPFGAWDWNLEQMSAYLRSRGIGWDTDFGVCSSIRPQLGSSRLHIEGRQGNPEDEKTWSEHVVIRPADWQFITFDEQSFDLDSRFWRTRASREGIATYVDLRVRSEQVLGEWPPGVTQSVSETIKSKPRVWVRHLETKPPAHYSEPGQERCYRHSWEVKIRSVFAPPPLRLAVRGAAVLRFEADLPQYYVEDESKPWEIQVTSPPPKFSFYADTIEPAAPQISCEFVT